MKILHDLDGFIAHVTAEGKEGEGREGELSLSASRQIGIAGSVCAELLLSRTPAFGNRHRAFKLSPLASSAPPASAGPEMSSFLWNSPSHMAAVERRVERGEEETSEAERHFQSPSHGA